MGEMRIGLASDSFGNVEGLEHAFDVFARAQAERVFFLGGRWADVDAVMARRRGGSRSAAVPEDDLAFLEAVRGALERQAAAPDPLEGHVVRVASRACPEVHRGQPTKVMEMVGGQVCFLVHDKGDLTREDIANALVLFHGNSTRAGMVSIGPRVFVTPGHLRRPAPDGQPASFALLDVGPHELEMLVFGEDGAELRREKVSFGARGKMTVR
jgi:predicted phosphodiesterase